MGVDVSLEKFIHDTTLNNYGTFSFDGTITGNALADFMLGLPRTMNQDAPITKIDNSWYCRPVHPGRLARPAATSP